MNSVRAAGVVPAAPFLIKLKVRRAALFACVGVLAALNAQAGQLLYLLNLMSPLDAVRGLAGISAVIWFAMYATLATGLQCDAKPPSRKDVLFAGMLVALCFLPFVFFAKAALLLCAFYLVLIRERNDPVRRVGIVLLSLTGPLIWGPIILDSFAAPLLSFDAHLVGGAIGTRADGNVVEFAGGSHQFLIGPYCSSVHNISLALVLWTTGAALFGVRFDRRYLGVGVAMVVFMFLLNIARLSVIGMFPANFSFLHDGAGADLFGWVAILSSGTIAFLGVDRAVRRQQ